MSEQHPNWCGHHGDVNCTCGLESRLTINSLKSKLAHKQEQCDQLAHENIELEDQFAEARAEIERLSALTGEWCKTAEMYRRFETEARKQTAREIVEMLRGAPNGFYIANMIKRRYGLEG